MRKVLSFLLVIVVIMGITSCKKEHTHTVADELIIVKEATCFTEGEGRMFCTECGEIVNTVSIPKSIDHTEVTIPGEESSCTRKGLTEGKKCSVCGGVLVAQQEIPLKAHQEEILDGIEPTCTQNGKTEGKMCSVCKEILVVQQDLPTTRHTYDDKYDKSCNVCGHIRDAECAHIETEIIKGYEATCMSTGLTNGEKCKTCGEILLSQTVIGVKAHNEVVDAGFSATCTSTGLTEGKHCDACGMTIIAQTVIPKLRHSYSSVIVEPTCTEQGYTIYTCHCGDNYIADYTEKIAHNFGEWVTIKEATETIDGVKERLCYCGEKETAPIPSKISASSLYVRDGDYIYFGEYPQTIKADDVIITTTTDVRGYYLGSDGYYYAKVTATPNWTDYTFSTGESVINGNVYYFKVEPIRWRILNENNGEALILCDSIIANHRFDDNSNNYAESEIRQWLNSTFYETAFCSLQQSIILTIEVDNGLASTGSSKNPCLCENTYDKVFLLSYYEVNNSSYGFSSANTEDARKWMLTSDYSRASGVFMCAYSSSSCFGMGQWWLRSPIRWDADYTRVVSYSGYSSSAQTPDLTQNGVVPALKIVL